MKTKFDKINVVDIEATCWEGIGAPREKSEIIEIGICQLDVRTMIIGNRQSIIVKPEHSDISQYCTDLTTLTQEKIDKDGISLESACELLQIHHETKQYPWASWGNYDRRAFEYECKRKQGLGLTIYPFGVDHINVKTLFTLIHRLKKPPGMSEALKLIGIPLQGTHHRATDDAYNVAAILSTLIGCCNK